MSDLARSDVVELYAYGDSPYPWIAMEYMAGGSLRDRMGKLDVPESLEVTVRLLEALLSAHHHGIITRT